MITIVTYAAVYGAIFLIGVIVGRWASHHED